MTRDDDDGAGTGNGDDDDHDDDNCGYMTFEVPFWLTDLLHSCFLARQLCLA